MEENLLKASFGLQLALTHVLRLSKSVALPFMHSMSVSSHGDDVMIVNVHFSYPKFVVSLRCLYLDVDNVPRMEADSLLQTQGRQFHSDFAHTTKAQR